MATVLAIPTVGAVLTSASSVAMTRSSCLCSSRTSYKPTCGPASFSASTFSGLAVASPSQTALRLTRPCLVIRALAAKPPVKKPDSAAKRARQAEKKRMYNKARKSEMTTRMKKVFVALEALRKSPEPSKESLLPIEKLISEAFKIIDKSVKVGTIHRNKGAHRKSRLSRAKRAVEIQLGWYTPPPPEPVPSRITILA